MPSKGCSAVVCHIQELRYRYLLLHDTSMLGVLCTVRASYGHHRPYLDVSHSLMLFRKFYEFGAFS